MRFNISFTRSVASLSFLLLLLIAAFARPALAQSADDASPDSSTAVSQLSVSPTALTYSVNLGKASSETKHFTLTNTGTLELSVSVNAPAGTDAGDYTISGPGLTASGGTILVPGKVNGSNANIVEVGVAFSPTAAGKNLDATILVTNNGSRGKTSDTIKLAGSAKGTLSTPTPGAFTPLTADMQSERSSHTATLLSNGQVLLTGGDNRFPSTGTTLNTAELYDPVADTFMALAATMTTAREGHTATLLPNGQVLITGGFGIGGDLNTAEVYEPVANTFTALTATITSARSNHTAILLPNGEVLITGGAVHSGDILNTAELYDPVAQTFTALTATMTTARQGHTATLLPNGLVFLTGIQWFRHHSQHRGSVHTHHPNLRAPHRHDDVSSCFAQGGPAPQRPGPHFGRGRWLNHSLRQDSRHRGSVRPDGPDLHGPHRHDDDCSYWSHGDSAP